MPAKGIDKDGWELEVVSVTSSCCNLQNGEQARSNGG